MRRAGMRGADAGAGDGPGLLRLIAAHCRRVASRCGPGVMGWRESDGHAVMQRIEPQCGLDGGLRAADSRGAADFGKQNPDRAAVLRRRGGRGGCPAAGSAGPVAADEPAALPRRRRPLNGWRTATRWRAAEPAAQPKAGRLRQSASLGRLFGAAATSRTPSESAVPPGRRRPCSSPPKICRARRLPPRTRRLPPPNTTRGRLGKTLGGPRPALRARRSGPGDLFRQ